MKNIFTLLKMKYQNLRRATERNIVGPRSIRNLLTPNHKNLIMKEGVDFLQIEHLSTINQNKEVEIETAENTLSQNTALHDVNIKKLEFILLFSVNNKRIWRQHLTRFQEPYMHIGERIKLAKSFSFFDALLWLHKEGYSLKSLFLVYKNIKDQLSVSNFSCSSYEYFTRKLKHMHINGIERSIVIAKKRVTRLKQPSEPQKKLVIEYNSSLERHSYADIRKKVNHKSVKAILSYPEILDYKHNRDDLK